MSSTATVMATRNTFDGVRVQFWTDGMVTTGFLGSYVKGIGIARDKYAAAANHAACWLLAGEVELYDFAELPKAVKIARAACANQQVLPLEYFRKRMAGKRLVCHMNALGSVAVVTWE